MTLLEQQLSRLKAQLERLQNKIPVDPQAMGLTLESHKPGNGSTYHRLRAPKGAKLANGKRTMSLTPKEVSLWEQKIYARNQQEKVAQCLSLIQKAAAIAGAITWELEALPDNTDIVEEAPVSLSKGIAPARTGNKTKRKSLFSHVKTRRGSIIHAIRGKWPEYGPWKAAALCGKRPPQQDYGWEFPYVNAHKVSCPKCIRKMPEDYEWYVPETD